MIKIKSKQRNFRRCGIAHPDTAVEYPDDKFTPEQLSILKAEPMLIVEVVREKAAAVAAPEKPEIPQEEAKEATNPVRAAETRKEPAKSKKGKK